MESNLPVLFVRKEDCCGCTACYAICPKSAITMTESEEGFEYQQVAGENLIRCYKSMQFGPVDTGRKK